MRENPKGASGESKAARLAEWHCTREIRERIAAKRTAKSAETVPLTSFCLRKPTLASLTSAKKYMCVAKALQTLCGESTQFHYDEKVRALRDSAVPDASRVQNRIF